MQQPQEWEALTRLCGTENWRTRWSVGQALAEAAESELADAIAARMAAQPRDAWVAKLHTAGVACMPCLRRTELLDHPHPALNASTTRLSYPNIGGVRHVARFARFGGGDPPPITAAAELGEHSVEVLREFGVDAGEVDELVNDAVVLSTRRSPVV